MNDYAAARYVRPHSVFGVLRQHYARPEWRGRERSWLFWSLPTLSELFWGRARPFNTLARQENPHARHQ